MRVRNVALAAAGATLITGGAVAATAATGSRHPAAGKLPTSAIEKIVGADGQTSDGILTIDISRDDLHAKGPDGTSFKPGFQLQHELAFQSVGPRRAVLNGDLALKPAETQKVIDAL